MFFIAFMQKKALSFASHITTEAQEIAEILRNCKVNVESETHQAQSKEENKSRMTLNRGVASQLL